MSDQTPWQTTGPFFHHGLCWKGGADLVGDSILGARPDLTAASNDRPADQRNANRHLALGHKIELTGRVFANTGAPVLDAPIEIWQANAAGRYANPEDARSELAIDPAFIGFGRGALDENGYNRFRTIRPGQVPGAGNTLQAPHIALGMVGLGILKRLLTHIYFADAPENAENPILALVPKERPQDTSGRARGGQTRHLPLRHPSGRRIRNGFLRHLGI